MSILEKLSPHFYLGELIISGHGSVDNTPGEIIIGRLRNLAVSYLEPIRAKFGCLWVTSGYRCQKLNEAIGGAPNSAHMFGQAVDFVAADRTITPIDIARWIRDESGLLYDQVIAEESNHSRWVHLGLLRPGFEPTPRKESLMMLDGKYSILT